MGARLSWVCHLWLWWCVGSSALLFMPCRNHVQLPEIALDLGASRHTLAGAFQTAGHEGGQRNAMRLLAQNWTGLPNGSRTWYFHRGWTDRARLKGEQSALSKQSDRMLLRVRGGGFYVTRADFIKAGTKYDEYNMMQDWGKLWQSRKWKPLTEEDAMYKGKVVPVLGIKHDGTFDNETTTLMQIRLAIERTDYESLRAAMYNACELPGWSARMEKAFEVGERALSILLRKVDFRLLHEFDDTRGGYRLTAEDKLGLRVAVPEGLAASQRTLADLLIGPRDGTTRLRIDQNLTMEENYAMWDALESEWLRKKKLPEVQNLTFEDPFVEAVFRERAEGAVASWRNVDTPWKRLRETAIKRAEEAIRNPEVGEVGSAWYHAEPAERHSAERYPDGAWWYVNGEVQRLPGLFWCNGRYTPVDEPARTVRRCPLCPYADCLHPKRERRRQKRLSAWREHGAPSPDPLAVARLRAGPASGRAEELLEATRRGNLQRVETALQAGAQVDCGNHSHGGVQPLHLAARFGYQHVVERLCAGGADVNARTVAGATPMHYAAHFGKSVVCEVLAGAGAEVNAGCKLGFTPLHEAAEQRHNYTTSKLLQLGADPWLRNHENFTALNIAESKYCAALSMLLRAAMCLPLCQCHGCAGYTTGFNNMLTEHITDAETTAYWDNELYDTSEFYNATFSEEMRRAEEEVEGYSQQLEAMGPMGEVDLEDGTWGQIKGGEWWLKMAEEKVSEFKEDYLRAYPPHEAQKPAAEAVDIFEALQQREKEEDKQQQHQQQTLSINVSEEEEGRHDTQS